jgi:hypothetical protein
MDRPPLALRLAGWSPESLARRQPGLLRLLVRQKDRQALPGSLASFQEQE